MTGAVERVNIEIDNTFNTVIFINLFKTLNNFN